MAGNPHGQFPWFGCLIVLGILIGILLLLVFAYLFIGVFPI